MERVKSGWQQGRIIYTYTLEGYNNYESSEYSRRCRTITDDGLIRELDYLSSDSQRAVQRMRSAKLLEGEKFDLQEAGLYKVYFSVANSIENIELANDLITQICSFPEHEKLAIRYSIACPNNMDALGKEIIFYLAGDKNLISNDLAAKAWLKFIHHIDDAFCKNCVSRSKWNEANKILGHYSYYKIGINELIADPYEEVLSFDLAGNAAKGKYGEPIITSHNNSGSMEFPDYFVGLLKEKMPIQQELA